MKKIARFLAILAAVSSLTACGALFTDYNGPVTIASDMSDATISMNGLALGKGHVTTQIPGWETPIFTASAPGCNSRSLSVQKTFNSIVILDIFLWPTFIVDVATGAIQKVSPTVYSLTPECLAKK